MRVNRYSRLLEGAILVLTLYAVLLRGSVFRGLLPSTWMEIGIELVLVVIAYWILRLRSLLDLYFELWKRNWLLFLFIVLAVASLFWTIDEAATISRTLALILSSALAAYIAVRYQLREILDITAGFFAVIAVFSFLFVFLWPNAGVMDFHPYYGAWRGIFWNRNYLGSIMALGSIILLLTTIFSWRSNFLRAVLYLVFYLFAIALVVLSRSATGLILAIVLHFAFLLSLLWLRLYPILQRVHYWFVGLLFVVVAGVGYSKLDFLLGLLGRNSTFTGRTGLWSFLLSHFIAQRPVLGFGFGAFWMQRAYHYYLQEMVGWGSPIVIGDDGYIDILLHLGIVGFIPFVAMLALAGWRMIKLAFRERTLLAFAPLLVMTYMLIANITLSCFLETESFIWLNLIIFMFASTPRTGRGKDARVQSPA